MGNKKGYNEAQSMEEMVQSEQERKEKALSVTRGRSIYKVQSEQFKEDVNRRDIQRVVAELANSLTKERVALENLEEVQKRSLVYLKACEEAGSFPSSLGLARALGYSDRTLRHWRHNRADTPTAQWLERFNDACAEILSLSALKNNANSISAIFLTKALYDFRETSEVVLTPNTPGIDTPEYSAEEIRSRYIIAEHETEED